MTAQNGTLASKEYILSIPDLEHVDVVVPEWNNIVVRLRELGASEVVAYQHSMITMGNIGPDGKPTATISPAGIIDQQARLIALCAIDAQGAQLFTTDDIRALGRKKPKAMARLYRAAAKLSGLATGEGEGEPASASADSGSPTTDSAPSSDTPPLADSSPS